METIRQALYNAHQAHKVLMDLWASIKPTLVAGDRLHLEVRAEKRTIPQNSHIHPIVRSIAKAAGRKTDEESLQRLRYMMLEQWRHETNRKPQWERSLDGERWVCVDGGTSDLAKPDCTEFIEWLYAFGAQHGVCDEVVA